jgi:hypothetical protein
MQAEAASRTDAASEYGAFGLELGDFDEAFEVWPENWASWQLFVQMSGQWRVGFNGRYALDYTSLFMRMDRMGLSDAAWEELFADVRILEASALQPADKTPRTVN